MTAVPDRRRLRVAVIDDTLRLARGAADWERFADRARIDFLHDSLPDFAARVQGLAPYDVLCVMRERTPFDARLLQALPNLSALITAGLRNPAIDLACAERLGITVVGTETPGVAAAELAWGLILAVMRGIAQEDRALRAGRWQTRLGEDLSGRTLGVLGWGRLGRVVGEVGRAFGMRVLDWSPDRSAGRPLPGSESHEALLHVLREADILSVHVVLSDITRGLLGEAELAAMKPSAYLVNTARSRIVDEAALVRALQQGRLAGAGLDVFDEEPLPLGHPLLELDNVVLTPHAGHVTRQTMDGFYVNMVDGLAALLAGAPTHLLAEPARPRPLLR